MQARCAAPNHGQGKADAPQAVKGQIIVNPKRLYKADQTAVPELLKVAGFLYGEGRGKV
jgi:hypothetical protein